MHQSACPLNACLLKNHRLLLNTDRHRCVLVRPCPPSSPPSSIFVNLRPVDRRLGREEDVVALVVDVVALLLNLDGSRKGREEDVVAHFRELRHVRLALLVCPHAHTHTHAHAHTRTQTHAHARKHAHTRARAHRHTHAHTQTPKHPNTHTHTHKAGVRTSRSLAPHHSMRRLSLSLSPSLPPSLSRSLSLSLFVSVHKVKPPPFVLATKKISSS